MIKSTPRAPEREAREPDERAAPKGTPGPPPDGAGPAGWVRGGNRWALAALAGGALLVAAAAVFHYRYFLPQPLKPTKYYLLDSVFQIAIAGLIMLSGATLGVKIVRALRLPGATRLETALLAYGLGTGALSLITAAVGLLGGFYFIVLAAVLVVPLVFFGPEALAVLRALVPTHPGCALAELRPRTTYESAVFAVAGLVALVIGEHALVPFWGFDVFMYHFAMPQHFLELHALYGSPGLPQANLPYNNEMLNLLALNFQAEIAGALVQTGFVVAMCLATFAIGTRLFSRRVAWLGMALFLVTPLVLYYATSGLIDAHFACMSLLVVITLLNYRDAGDWRWVLAAGLLTGIGLGVKYQTVYLVAPLVPVLVWWSRPADGATGPWQRAAARNLALLGGGALATFALWAGREWVQVGNPIYPLIWGGADWTPARMAFYRAQFDNFGSLRTSVLRYAIATFDWFWHWQKYDYTAIPPEPAYALAALAPLSLLGRGSRGARGDVLLVLWLVVASFTLWGLVDQLIPRYVLPSFGLLALLAGVALDGAVAWLGRRLAAGGRDLVLATAALVFLLPGVLYAVQIRQQSDPSPVYTGQESYGLYLRSTQLWPSYWRAADYFNAEAPPDARVLGVNLAASYFFTDPYLTPDMNRDVIIALAQAAPTDAAKLAWLRAHGYAYVIYDRTVSQWSLDRDPDHILTPLLPPFEAFLAHDLILVRTLDGTDVYMVPPAG